MIRPTAADFRRFSDAQLYSATLTFTTMRGLLGLTIFQTAPASTMAPADAVAGETHGHNCKCASRCQGASCCCGPREGQTRLLHLEPNPEPGRPGAGECMTKSAPCDNSGLPSTPSEGPVNRNAALAVLEHRRHDALGTLLPFSSRNRLPVRRASRLDRPPELLVLA